MPTDAHLPRLVIAGAGGVIGRALLRVTAGRYERVVLTRGGTLIPGTTAVTWSPSAARDGDSAGIAAVAGAVDGAAGIVNLAGSSIAGGRLGPRHLARLRSSRVDAGATLRAALDRCAEPPRVWFQASAVDVYGDGGEHELDERWPVAATTPVAEVMRAWEASAPDAGTIRVVTGRIGIVLARRAEAWRRLVLSARLYVGGPLGSGRQWWPWIYVADLARAIVWLLEREQAVGTYNLVAEPIRQADLARAIARRLRRPATVRVPAFALRLLLGGVADTLLLSSKRVVPARLITEGFVFEAPLVDAAVARLLPRR